MSTNEKKLLKISWICFALLSVPVIVIAFYSHPSVDDYAYGRDVHLWIQNHGYDIFGILKCAALFAYNYYFKWAGSYADSFTGALMPENFGCYWISAVIIYSMLTGGLVFLFRSLAAGLAGKEYQWTGSICALFGIIAITQNWPSPVEALYWFDGAQSYMGYHAVYLWMCGMAVRYFFHEEQRKSVRALVIVSFLALIAAGGNNVTSFMSILTYCIFLGAAVYFRRKRGIIVPFAVSVAGFLVSFLSPATTVRGGGSGNYTPIILTIVKCFRWTIRQYVLGWTSFGIGLMLLFLTPFLVRLMRKTAENYSFQFPCPLLALAGSFCFLSAMSSPAFYILGESGPLRLHNLIYVNFIILVILVYAYFLGWLTVNKLSAEQSEYISEIYRNMALRHSIPLAAVAVLWLCAGAAGKYGTSIEAAKELFNGTAARYHEEIMKRYELYKDPSVTEVVAEPLSVKPELIFFDDITDDETNWKNTSTAKYFGKELVKLRVRDPDIDYE